MVIKFSSVIWISYKIPCDSDQKKVLDVSALLLFCPVMSCSCPKRKISIQLKNRPRFPLINYRSSYWKFSINYFGSDKRHVISGSHVLYIHIQPSFESTSSPDHYHEPFVLYPLSKCQVSFVTIAPFMLSLLFIETKIKDLASHQDQESYFQIHNIIFQFHLIFTFIAHNRINERMIRNLQSIVITFNLIIFYFDGEK